MTTTEYQYKTVLPNLETTLTAAIFVGVSIHLSDPGGRSNCSGREESEHEGTLSALAGLDQNRFSFQIQDLDSVQSLAESKHRDANRLS